jgi:hypothetical protein
MEKNRTLNRAKAIVLRVHALFEDWEAASKKFEIHETFEAMFCGQYWQAAK